MTPANLRAEKVLAARRANWAHFPNDEPKPPSRQQKRRYELKLAKHEASVAKRERLKQRRQLIAQKQARAADMRRMALQAAEKGE